MQSSTLTNYYPCFDSKIPVDIAIQEMVSKIETLTREPMTIQLIEVPFPPPIGMKFYWSCRYTFKGVTFDFQEVSLFDAALNAYNELISMCQKTQQHGNV